MHAFHCLLTLYMFEISLVVLCLLNSIRGRRFTDEDVYGRAYGPQEQEAKVEEALKRLENVPVWESNWPDPSVKLGQVSGVALTASGLLLVFHRGPNVWDGTTFNMRNVYQNIGDPSIAESTVLVFSQNGTLVDKWGENLFYMPHGITSDESDNVWVTDVALHQVFKFNARERTKPAMLLGEKFVPGDDDSHFCKPSAVAVMSSGDFFVADGYCNARIIKYAPDGTKILQWGRRSGDSPFVFEIPHALALAPDRGQLCVADRERGRVACFLAANGTYVNSYSSWLIGGRLFSVAYAPVKGGRLYVVNGPPFSGDVPVRGYVIDFESGRLLQSFAPAVRGGSDSGEDSSAAPGTALAAFSNPHDIAVTPDGSSVYVAELRPFKVYKFVDEKLRNATSTIGGNTSIPAKPTATVEADAPPPNPGAAQGDGWGGAAGRAAGGAALGAALLAGGALLLRARARARGHKSVPRRRWEYGQGEFKLRRLLARRRFTRVRSDDSDEEPDPMLPPPTA